MPRAKKTDEATLEVKAEQTKKPTVDDFRQACIDLGLQICEDFETGKVRPEASLVTSLTGLFEAVKG